MTSWWSKQRVESQRGKFNGTGTASGQRDAKLADSLVELAETRAIARALRFGGIGVEYTGAEEVSHVAAADSEKEQSWQQSSLHQYSLKAMATAKGKRKRQVALRLRQDQNRKVAALEGNPGAMSSALCPDQRANYHEADIGEMLARFEVSRFEDLSRESASQLIGHLQTQVAA